MADLEEDNLQRAEKPSTADARTALDVDAEDVVVKLEEVTNLDEINTPSPSTAPHVSDSNTQLELR